MMRIIRVFAVKKYDEHSNKGYFLEEDIDYLKELFNFREYLPFLPGWKSWKSWKSWKIFDKSWFLLLHIAHLDALVFIYLTLELLGFHFHNFFCISNNKITMF